MKSERITTPYLTGGSAWPNPHYPRERGRVCRPGSAKRPRRTQVRSRSDEERGLAEVERNNRGPARGGILDGDRRARGQSIGERHEVQNEQFQIGSASCRGKREASGRGLEGYDRMA